jgi:hypothetical protein
MKLLDRAKYRLDGERGVSSATQVDGNDVAAPLRLMLVITNALVLVCLQIFTVVNYSAKL